MTTSWILQTDGDVLGTMRRFLHTIWRVAELDGMLVPFYQDSSRVGSRLIEDPALLVRADPCVPLMTVNAARQAARLAQERLAARLALVLRPCEARAWAQLNRQAPLQPPGWLTVGVDCLASYPVDDWDWRVAKAGSIENVTRENLGHARQGGIAPYRYRLACQMCIEPQAQQTDLCICVLGLPARQAILVRARDAALAGQLKLSEIAVGPAPEMLLRDHKHLLAALEARRQRTLERFIEKLSLDLPADAGDLVRQLQSCAPCQQCLAACPLYAGELDGISDGDLGASHAFVRWLAGCVACGMCEQACPRHLPLTAILTRIKLELPVACPA